MKSNEEGMTIYSNKFPDVSLQRPTSSECDITMYSTSIYTGVKLINYSCHKPIRAHYSGHVDTILNGNKQHLA